MDIEPHTPPRTFAADRRGGITIRHCADVHLRPDEMVTFVTESGARYDVVRKAWGYYAAPSLNHRLPASGFRPALVRNAADKLFLLLVEAGREPEFQAYLDAEGHGGDAVRCLHATPDAAMPGEHEQRANP